MQSMEWISKSLLILPVEDVYWKKIRNKKVYPMNTISRCYSKAEKVSHPHNLEKKITWNDVCELINETCSDNNAIRRKSLWQKAKIKQNKLQALFYFPWSSNPGSQWPSLHASLTSTHARRWRAVIVRFEAS